jgi:hypothetical protein
LQRGTNLIKLLLLSLMLSQNKLECWSSPSLAYKSKLGT